MIAAQLQLLLELVPLPGPDWPDEVPYRDERDREGLKRALMERRVKAQRLEELVKAGTEAGSLDDIEIPAKDYPKYLERAYKGRPDAEIAAHLGEVWWKMGRREEAVRSNV